MRRANVIAMENVVAMARHFLARGHYRAAAFVALAGGLGLRAQDAAALRWADVLDEAGNVARTVVVKEKKNRTRRTVVLMPWVRDVLTAVLRATRPQDLTAPIVGFSRQRAHALVRRAARELGLKGVVSPHSLRKAFCHTIYSSVQDPVVAARMTGHKNPVNLLAYIGETTHVEQEVWRKLEAVYHYQ